MENKGLTPHQEYIIDLCLEHKTFCAGQLVDEGIIPKKGEGPFHQTLRRVARRRGIDTGKENPGWLPQLVRSFGFEE